MSRSCEGNGRSFSSARNRLRGELGELLDSSKRDLCQVENETYLFMDFMALITAMVSCARSQDSLLSVSVRRLHVVFSTGRFKGGGKSCPKTRETAALRRRIQKLTVRAALALSIDTFIP